MFKINPETEEDEWEVEVLLDTAFGPGRMALSSYSLRAGVEMIRELSVISRDDLGILCGVIRFWPIKVGGSDALLLGPIAVHPTRQGEGLGSILIRKGIDNARNQGWQNIVLIGDEPYYKRFGFTRSKGIVFPPPTDPDRILQLQLDGSTTCRLSGLVTKIDIA